MATEGSWIPTGISATINDLAGLYGQVEAAKLQAQLAKAQASANAWNLPTVNKNPQATQPAQAINQGVSPWLIGAGVGGAILLVYLLVK